MVLDAVFESLVALLMVNCCYVGLVDFGVFLELLIFALP